MKTIARDHIPAMLGIAISIVASLVAYFLGVSADVGFLSSLLGIVISLQVDALVRYSAVRADLRTLGEFTDWLLRGPSYLPFVQSIARSLDRIGDATGTTRNPAVYRFFPGAAEEVLAQCQESLATLADGSLSTSTYDFRPLIQGLSQCRHELRAVSVQGVDRLVSGEIGAGADYFEVQRTLIGRGVKVERVFIYDRRDASLGKNMDQQKSIGVKVYEVQSRTVPDDLKIDCAIIDRDFFGNVKVGSTGRIIGTYYSTNRAQVDRMIRSFEELKSLASEYAPVQQ